MKDRNSGDITQRLLLISDFTGTNFLTCLQVDPSSLSITGTAISFLEIQKEISAPRSTPHHSLANYDCGLLWIQPSSAFPAFQDLINGESVSPETILRQTDSYVALVKEIALHIPRMLLCTFTYPGSSRHGPNDMRSGMGAALIRANARLVELLCDDSYSSITLIDPQRWFEKIGNRAYSSKLWFMAKVPYSNEVFQEAVSDLKSILSSLQGSSRKLLILDLDNTLWGGIVGDDGWENLTLGGHDPIGEAFSDFQKAILSLKRRGVLLALVSKNEESVALEAMKNHPEMVLKIDDFVAWRINWEDKAQNILSLMKELNLNLDAAVFIDDNPAERARVHENLPEVLVPELPENPLRYPDLLRSMNCFDTLFITEEDTLRTELYQSEKAREKLKETIATPEDWLRSLTIKVTIERLDRANLSRATQLLNKTNQMNLSTRRLTTEELWKWAQHKDNAMWTIRVADRLGDLGLTGLIGIHKDTTHWQVTDFVLSCRVFGRNIEDLMLIFAAEQARIQKAERILLTYQETPKNKPCIDFLKRSGLEQSNGTQFSWNLSQQRSFPTELTVEVK